VISAEEENLITDAFPTDALSWLMATCSKLLRESLNQRFSEAGYKVTPEQWALLAHLWQQDGLSQQALASRFHRSKVSAFQLINRLEEQGLLFRRSDPGDGRSNLIYLTPKGRSIQSALVVLAQENMTRALAGISEAELKTAKSVVRKIINNTKG
jgi:DNA-binding MarR family transcriptional regulator